MPPPYLELNEAADDESMRLTADEVETELRATWWRGQTIRREDEPTVWFCATRKAEALA